jgi:hypothetical protein
MPEAAFALVVSACGADVGDPSEQAVGAVTAEKSAILLCDGPTQDSCILNVSCCLRADRCVPSTFCPPCPGEKCPEPQPCFSSVCDPPESVSMLSAYRPE